MKTIVWCVGVVSLVLLSCASEQGSGPVAQAQVKLPEGVMTPEVAAASHKSFGTYWYQGLAEMSRYKLTQARYGELHEGEAVLIFVTEDFLTDKQIKHEFGPGDKAVPILKLNAYRRFYTGIYPYTMLTSVFKPTTPVSAPPLKITANSQEWCGMTYTQLNRREEGWKVQAHSYFQAEGDQAFALAGEAAEDGVWVQLRRDPAALPTGEMEMVPGMHYLRLMHREIKPYKAIASVEEAGAGLKRWKVSYPALDRTLVLTYQDKFPYQIQRWEETYQGLGGRALTTKGELTHAMLSDYWSRHTKADAPMRDALGLEW